MSTNDNDRDFYTPAEAVQYLREVRGIVLSVDGLRNRRRMKTAQAHRVLANNSIWTKKELDAIEASKWTKRVEPAKKNSSEAQLSVA